MELTILLSKVFGIYFLLVGLTMLIHHSHLKAISRNFVEEPMMRYLFGAFMLMGGIFLVVAHQDWSTTPSSFISLLGWLTIIKALLYMNLSNSGARKWINGAYKIGYAWWGSFLVLALGAYLLNFGYGLY